MVLAGDIALCVGGCGAQTVRLGFRAHPRLHLRTGENRSADRVIRDCQASAGTAATRSDDIRSFLESGDERDHARVCTLFECTADIATIHIDAQTVGRTGFRQRDLNERIAAADEIGAIGKDLDFERRAGTGTRAAGACRQHCRRTDHDSPSSELHDDPPSLFSRLTLAIPAQRFVVAGVYLYSAARLQAAVRSAQFTYSRFSHLDLISASTGPCDETSPAGW